ncbi:4-(cytidine 5'-diphospho)-2-C-methyl-D-erythritol kinase [Motilibacter aurantiacus]|uniref:4-(cytidine 5'-diphospho)-2-C-methyl-D-erythritol kinase n=1 Tax=Motilibacter aurantiacus TaxID=2714955 RepID=UPI001409A008|nr:4-(cytidine 5'-diphospho)-2-C-methyl-D-erythritol kinase [Motilibacter aurantiacus]NHC45930.1 4-(cytidine 5'-diphospho)-2-C-methyl-D-erythritol kinase [Motilibacter aurantiacus]
MGRVRVRVPAKVNLQLAVGPLRPDGFHDVVTVYSAVSLHDQVTVETSDRLEMVVTGEQAAGVPADATNLAARAAELVAARAGVEPRVRITLDKGIPVAGGMAGGSADAAGALLACATLWDVPLDAGQLQLLAAQLGSDVPFALVGGTAVGRGRGERLTAVPAQGRQTWVFALADGGLSTPAVYAECDRLREGQGVGAPEASTGVLEALASGDPAALGAALANDLQPAACTLRPGLVDVLAAGRGLALGALVSGSGPTCAFLASDDAAARALARRLATVAGVREARVATGPVDGARVVSSDPS